MKEYVYGKKAITSFFVIVIILSAIIDVLYIISQNIQTEPKI